MYIKINSNLTVFMLRNEYSSVSAEFKILKDVLSVLVKFMCKRLINLNGSRLESTNLWACGDQLSLKCILKFT